MVPSRLQIPSTERRVVGICWEHLKPKGPKGRKGVSWGYDGRNQNLKDLKSFWLQRTSPHPPTQSLPPSGILFPVDIWGIRGWSSYALNHGIPYEPSADSGSGVCASAFLFGITQTPQENHLVSPLHEHLHWRAKRDPKAKMLSLQSFLRKGVSLGYVGRN